LILLGMAAMAPGYHDDGRYSPAFVPNLEQMRHVPEWACLHP
jgi:hypothetical protein